MGAILQLQLHRSRPLTNIQVTWTIQSFKICLRSLNVNLFFDCYTSVSSFYNSESESAKPLNHGRSGGKSTYPTLRGYRAVQFVPKIASTYIDVIVNIADPWLIHLCVSACRLSCQQLPCFKCLFISKQSNYCFDGQL